MAKNTINSDLWINNVRDQIKKKNRRRRQNIRRSAASGASVYPPRNDLMPPLTLIECAIDDLKLPAHNVRKKDQAHIDEIMGSISTLGFCDPPLVNADLEVIDGANAIEALRRLGIKTVSCIRIDHLDHKMQRLLRIALNRLQEKGVWDFDELKQVMQDLISLDAPIEISGFSSIEIDQLVLGEEVSAAEAGPLAPTAGAVPVGWVGDIYVCGQHRVGCGDARNPETLARLMIGQYCKTVLTDPPYNVRIGGNVTGGDHPEFLMASGEMTAAEYLEFTVAWMENVRGRLVSGGILAPFIDWRGLSTIIAAAQQLWLAQINLVVWGKSNAGMGSLYRSQHELLPIFCMGGAPIVNNVKLGRNGRWRSNLWSYPGASSFGSEARKGLEYHPTVKPMPMLSDALLDFTKKGDVVLDPFLGSGSTLMAADSIGRRCFGLELAPLYVDVIIQRYEKATGKAAVLEQTGETFQQVAERRRSEGISTGG